MTSYIICHKRLGIKKSDIELLKKSVEDRKLEYFKSELLKILDKKEMEKPITATKAIEMPRLSPTMRHCLQAVQSMRTD